MLCNVWEYTNFTWTVSDIFSYLPHPCAGSAQLDLKNHFQIVMHTWWLHFSREKSFAIWHNKRESCSLALYASFLNFCVTCYSGSPAYMILTFSFPILSSFHRGCCVGNCSSLLFQQWLRRQVTKQDSSNPMVLVSFSISQLFLPKALQLTSPHFLFFGMTHQRPNQEWKFG